MCGMETVVWEIGGPGCHIKERRGKGEGGCSLRAYCGDFASVIVAPILEMRKLRPRKV